MAWYIDTSALVKLIAAERETRAMHEWIADTEPELVSSQLVHTELVRAVARAGFADQLAVSEGVGAVDLLPATPALFAAAGALEPATLRSLDALHLATALDLGDSCSGMITYDDRLASAATARGLAVIAPS